MGQVTDEGAPRQLSEAGVDELLSALAERRTSAVELAALSMNRLFAYDRAGPELNAVPVLNPDVFREAAASDARRAAGLPPRPLEGVPFTVKDSYKVRGLTVANGSPAFAELVADEDAFTVARLREAGAVLIGKTNMPPMADGGLQRGVYGRAESPYNPACLPAAWNSGSSNGAGVATTVGFAAFGMAEETVSSGRSPASNNALVAYTPSRGLISVRGNWPLRPLRDVIVPLARSMSDLFRVLDVIVAPDPETEGDLWRTQTVAPLPAVAEVRPPSYATLADGDALRGKRIGVPTIYLGKDATGRTFRLRPSIRDLWDRAVADLEGLGATVVEVGFPLFHDYEEDRPDAVSPAARGLIPEAWWNSFGPAGISSSRLEKLFVSGGAWARFLESCGDPAYRRWTDVDPARIFPYPEGSVDARRKGGFDPFYEEVRATLAGGVPKTEALPGFADALRGLEAIRRECFEAWLDGEGLDAIVFPANGDVASATSDTVDEDYDFACSPGVSISNGGGMIRHLGIPTVSAPMGLAADLQMPVNLTFAGRAYSDSQLLAFGYAYEQRAQRRRPPPRMPALPGEDEALRPGPPRVTFAEAAPPAAELAPDLRFDRATGQRLRVSGRAEAAAGLSSVDLFIDGELVEGEPEAEWSRVVAAPRSRDGALRLHVHALLVVRDRLGRVAADARRYRVPLAAGADGT